MKEERMGLLTDPNNRQRGALTQFLLNHHTKLSWLSFSAGQSKAPALLSLVLYSYYRIFNL
jgi:hypothetical protein